MAAVSILVYVIFVLLSFSEAGQLSTYYGSAGILALLLSLSAIVLAIQSMLEEDSFKKFPRLAILFSVIAVLMWGATYGMGFVL